jgi:hypothetical protein
MCAGLVQSLLVGMCLGLTMAIRLIPSAVLWGYFAFMALESLAGSQFWDRLLYLATDPAKRYRYRNLPAPLDKAACGREGNLESRQQLFHALELHSGQRVAADR